MNTARHDRLQYLVSVREQNDPDQDEGQRQRDPVRQDSQRQHCAANNSGREHRLGHRTRQAPGLKERGSARERVRPHLQHHAVGQKHLAPMKNDSASKDVVRAWCA